MQVGLMQTGPGLPDLRRVGLIWVWLTQTGSGQVRLLLFDAGQVRLLLYGAGQVRLLLFGAGQVRLLPSVSSLHS